MSATKEKFYEVITAKRDIIEEAGLKFPGKDDDYGLFLNQLAEYYSEHKASNAAIANLFLENAPLFGAVFQDSEFVKKVNPYKLELRYKDKLISAFNFGYNPISQQESDSLHRSFGLIVNSLPNINLSSYLSDNPERRLATKNFLMSVLDYNTRLNWVNIWAFTDRIRDTMPDVYEKMTKEDEFLTVEELWAKVEQQEGRGLTSDSTMSSL